MFLDVFDCKPGEQEPESLGATPHEFVVEGVLFYVDPHNEIALSPQCTAMTVRVRAGAGAGAGAGGDCNERREGGREGGGTREGNRQYTFRVLCS